MSHDETQTPQHQSTSADPAREELVKLELDLDRGAVRSVLHGTADSRNPGCSGK